MRFDQRIERIEKFFLSSILAAEKLDVVYQQNIKRMIVSFEIIKSFMLVSPYYVGNILFRVNIPDLGRAVVFQYKITDSLNQVSFAQPDAAVNKKWVISGAWTFGNLNGARPRQLIRFSGNEIIKSERWIQTARIFFTFFLASIANFCAGTTGTPNGAEFEGGVADGDVGSGFSVARIVVFIEIGSASFN